MHDPPTVTAVLQDGAKPHSTSQQPLPWWSFTKTALAVAALLLVADRRLGLDAPVGTAPFTLRHLLQHRSGLPDYGHLAAYHAAVADRQDPWPRDLLLHRAGSDTLAFPPGEGWAYSNLGYMLVRELIETTTGQEIGAALADLVLRPLHLTATRLAYTRADLDTAAWTTPRYHPGWVYHGLLVGPAHEAAALLHALLQGNLLPAPQLREMLIPHPVGGPVPGRPWQTANYGLGLMIGSDDTGQTYVGHTGGGPGSTAAVYQAHPGRTAAAFAPREHPAAVERSALAPALPLTAREPA